MILHTDAVTEDRSAGIRTTGIDRDHRDGLPFPANKPSKLIAQSALSGSGRTRYAQYERAARVRKKLAQERLRFRMAIFDPRCGASQRTKVAT